MIIVKLVLLYILVRYILYPHIDFFTAQRDPLLDELKLKLQTLDPRLKSVEVYASNKSYTVDKRRTYICARDDKGKYYPVNMLVYVLLHEFAHALSSTHDPNHTSQEFHETFDALLKKAAKMGYYDPSVPVLENYCGYQ